MTIYYFAADIAPHLDKDPKFVWRTVRQHHITPEMVGNKYGITLAQVKVLERSAAVTIPRKQKPPPQPAAPKPKPMPGIPRRISAKEKAIAPTSTFTLTAGKKVNQDQLERNRQQIAAAEARVRAGKVKPRVVPAGTAVPQPWQWSAKI